MWLIWPLENGGAAGKRGTVVHSLCSEFADIVIKQSVVSGYQHSLFGNGLREYQMIEWVFVTWEKIQLLERGEMRKRNIHNRNSLRNRFRVQIGA